MRACDMPCEHHSLNCRVINGAWQHLAWEIIFIAICFVHFLKKKLLKYHRWSSRLPPCSCLPPLTVSQSRGVRLKLEVELVFSVPVRLWLTSISLQCTTFIKPCIPLITFSGDYSHIQKRADKLPHFSHSLCLSFSPPPPVITVTRWPSPCQWNFCLSTVNHFSPELRVRLCLRSVECKDSSWLLMGYIGFNSSCHFPLRWCIDWWQWWELLWRLCGYKEQWSC